MAAITRRTLVSAGALAAALGIGVTGVVLADDDGSWDSDDTDDASTDDGGYGGYGDDGYGDDDGGAYGTASPVSGASYDPPRTSAS